MRSCRSKKLKKFAGQLRNHLEIKNHKRGEQEKNNRTIFILFFVFHGMAITMDKFGLNIFIKKILN